MPLSSIVLGLTAAAGPCALPLLLFLAGFLLITARRKNMLKNTVAFVTSLFIALFISSTALRIPVNSLPPEIILIEKILTLTFGIYGIIRFFSERQIFVKGERYILSIPFAILFGALFSVTFLFCSAGTIVIAAAAGMISVLLYLLGFVAPLVAVSLILLALCREKEEGNTRYMRLIGGIMLVARCLIL